MCAHAKGLARKTFRYLIANITPMIHRSTFLLLQGRGVVYRTGDNTYIGAIAGLAAGTGQTKSSMEREVEHVAMFISIFGAITAIALFVIALARGLGFTYAIVYGFVLVLGESPLFSQFAYPSAHVGPAIC